MMENHASKFTWRYAILVCLFFTPCMIDITVSRDTNMGSILLYFIYLITTPLLGLYLIIKLIVYLFRKQLQRAFSVLAAPLAVIAFFFVTGASHLANISDWIRLQIHKNVYLQEIATMPTIPGHPKTKSFHVGSWGWVGCEGDYDYVYDESDKIKDAPCMSVTPMGDHFYFTNTNLNCCANK